MTARTAVTWFKYLTNHSPKRENSWYTLLQDHCWWLKTVILCLAAFKLHAPGGAADSGALPQRESYTLAHGHHLGRGQSAEGLPALHAWPAVHAGLEMGFLHQPQCHRLPHQVSITLDRALKEKNWIIKSVLLQFFEVISWLVLWFPNFCQLNLLDTKHLL